MFDPYIEKDVNHQPINICPKDCTSFRFLSIYCYKVVPLLGSSVCVCDFISGVCFLYLFLISPLRKQAYSNILKILPTKNENFQTKNSDIFHISAQNIDCGYSLEPPRRGGSNEYPQSMFMNGNKKKIMYTPVNPSLTI